MTHHALEEPEPVQRARNPRGAGARLRDEILKAATDLVDSTGDPASLTLRGIARRAGISAPPIYRHFENLDALIEAMLERSFDELRRLVGDAISTEPAEDPARALVAAGLAYVQFGWDRKARYQMMFSADGYASNAVETFALVEELIRRAAADGSGTSTDPRRDAWLLWAGMHGVATLAAPAREDYRRLGSLDRAALLATMIRRLAQLNED